jgi:PAS domain S-box-containing protein
MTAHEVAGTREFAAFLEVVPDPIVAASRDGAIMFVNSLAASLFGYERDELLGEPTELLMPWSACEASCGGRIPTRPIQWPNPR